MKRYRTIWLMALMSALVLAGCRDRPAPDRRPLSTAAPGVAVPSSPASPVELSLAFAGDVHFTGRTRRLLDFPGAALGPMTPYLRTADFAMVNLETAITARGTPEPKTYHFRAPASAYAALREAGVDAVSLANNHTLDYGRTGLVDTLALAQATEFPVVGAGHNAEEAYRPLVTTVRGVRIGVVAFSQIAELAESWRATPNRSGIAVAFDQAAATAAVRTAREQADLVIVYMHWGVEGSSCPNQEMKDFAAVLSAAGADIVVGTHAHVLLADGWLGNTYVHYGLGNFLWYSSSRSTDTGVLQLTVRGHQVIRKEFVPGMISNTGQAVPVQGFAEQRLRDKLAAAQQCSGLAATGP